MCALSIAGCRNDGDHAAGAAGAAGAVGAVGAVEEVFVDATGGSGLDFVHFNGMSGELYLVEMMGPGGALLDYDNDGDLDVFVRQGTMLPADVDAPSTAGPLGDRLFRNDPLRRPDLAPGSPGFRLTDVTGASGVGFSGYGMGATTGDYDNDGFVDLYLTDFGANRLLRNNGDGTFADATAETGTGDDGWGVAATFFDFDRDGWLDLYVGNYVDFTLANHHPCFRPSSAPDYCSPLSYRPAPDRLFHNRRDGSFEDVTAESGLAAAIGSTLGAIAVDADADGWPDLLIANDGMENRLWLNRGDGTFEEQSAIRGVAVNQSGAAEGSMGIDAYDFDLDGDEDLFLTHIDTETNTLYVNQGDGTFLDRTLPAGLATPSRGFTGFGTGWLDYDNDGFPDLLAVNGAVTVIEELELGGDPHPLHQPNQLFRNLGDGTFRDVSAEAGAALARSEVSRGALFGDLDNDGDTDLVVVNNHGPSRLLINRIGQRRAWIGVSASAGPAGRHLVGAWVGIERAGGARPLQVVRTDGGYGSAHDPRIIVGLGEVSGTVDASLTWGEAQPGETIGSSTLRFEGLRAGVYATLVEPGPDRRREPPFGSDGGASE